MEMWCHELGVNNIDSEYCNSVFLSSHKCTKNVRYIQLHYNIIHRILVTNRSLFLMGIKDSDSCTFCNDHRETILHLLVECHMVDQFWKHLINWLNLINIKIRLSPDNIIFGLHHSSTVLNYILLIAKKYIYVTRCYGKIPLFQNVLSILKFNLKDEKLRYEMYDNVNLFWQKWGIIYNKLQ